MDSIIPSSEQSSRAIQLIGLLCDGLIPPEQLAELDHLVVTFPQICRNYLEIMSMHGDLHSQAALFKPENSTDSSVISAIWSRTERQPSETDGASPPKTAAAVQASKADLNETLILPAVPSSLALDYTEAEPAIDPPMKILPPPAPKRFPWRMVAAVLLPLFALSTFWAIRSSPIPKPPVALGPEPTSSPSVTPIPSPQCIVSLALDAKWSDPDDSSLITGSALGLGLHGLDAGTIKLEMPGNAMVVVESPAQFEVLSSKSIRLIQGKLCALLIKGGGLTVVTPDLTAVDLGTEFALDVASGKQTHLEVLQGAVRAAATTPSASVAFKNVVAGEAVMVPAGSSEMKKDTPRPLAFLRPSEVQADDGTSYQRWARFSQTIRQDTDLLAYYPFDADSFGTNQLRNSARQTAGMYNGALGIPGSGDASNPAWVQGRWPGKPALQFGGARITGVTINAQPNLIPRDAMTLCCWIKRTDAQKAQHILAGEDENGRAFNLGLTHNAPGGLVDRFNFTWAQFNIASGPAPYQANRWDFIAVTSTVQGGSRFYLNGQLLSEDKALASFPVVVNQLIIGAPATGSKLSFPNEYFDGLMDELMVYHRVLSSEEIAHLFKVGSPS